MSSCLFDAFAPTSGCLILWTFSKRISKNIVGYHPIRRPRLVNKEYFIESYCEARKAVGKKYIIRNAWKKAGLCPWDPNIAIGKLPTNINIDIRPVTPPGTGLTLNGFKTLANVQQMYDLIQAIKYLDP